MGPLGPLPIGIVAPLINPFGPGAGLGVQVGAIGIGIGGGGPGPFIGLNSEFDILSVDNTNNMQSQLPATVDSDHIGMSSNTPAAPAQTTKLATRDTQTDKSNRSDHNNNSTLNRLRRWFNSIV